MPSPSGPSPATRPPSSDWTIAAGGRELPDDGWFRALAVELNLPATGFVLPAERRAGRLPACAGSARAWSSNCAGTRTLASARCLFDDGVTGPIRFGTRAGVLDRAAALGRRGGAGVPGPAGQPDRAAGRAGRGARVEPVWVGEGGDKYLVELVDAAARPASCSRTSRRCPSCRLSAVVVTACSDLPDADFVSRCFAPALGNPEDPVTGSAHTVLGPFWAPGSAGTSWSACSCPGATGTGRRPAGWPIGPRSPAARWWCWTASSHRRPATRGLVLSR